MSAIRYMVRWKLTDGTYRTVIKPTLHSLRSFVKINLSEVRSKKFLFIWDGKKWLPFVYWKGVVITKPEALTIISEFAESYGL